MEKHFFKVRRLIGYAGKDEILGIVVPNVHVNGYPEKLCYTTDFYTLDNQIFKNIELDRFLDTKSVRITNKDLKEKINTFVAEAKKAFNIKKRYSEEQIKFLTQTREIKTRLTDVQKSFVEVQGFMSKFDFLKQFAMDSVDDYVFGWEFDVLKIKALTLTKEYFLGKYLNEDAYDFLYEEYDGELMSYDDMIEKDESEDFRRIKRENFKKVSTNKMGNHTIVEEFYVNTGDKRSAYIDHRVSLYLENPIELKESNIDDVKALRKAFKDLLK